MPQVEAHPYLQQPRLEEWCRAHSILLTAYAPLAPLTKLALSGGPVDAPVAAAAAAHGTTAAQVLLRWCLQTGKGILTTTSSPARLEEYKGAFSFELAREQVESISLAGRSSPRRMFWTQCTPKFREDPREELTSCDGTDVHDHVGSSL